MFPELKRFSLCNCVGLIKDGTTNAISEFASAQYSTFFCPSYNPAKGGMSNCRCLSLQLVEICPVQPKHKA